MWEPALRAIIRSHTRSGNSLAAWRPPLRFARKAGSHRRAPAGALLQVVLFGLALPPLLYIIPCTVNLYRNC